MGKSKDLATGNSAAYVETAGDTMSGTLNVNGGNFYLAEDNAAAHRYMFLNTGASQDGHIVLQRALANKYQITAKTDNSYSIYGYPASGEVFNIDSSGRVTMPYQPAFMSHKNGSHLEASGHNRVQSWTEFFDVGSHFDNSTGRFVAPIAGKYFFTFNAMHSGNVAGDLQFKIYKNGTEYIKSNDTSDGGSWDQCTVVCIMDMAANDYAEPYQYSNNNSNSEAVYNGKYSSWMGYLLG